MKTKQIFFFMFIPFILSAKNGITFQIEELSKPEKLLPLAPYGKIQKLKEFPKPNNFYEYIVDSNIIAKSKAPDSLVIFGEQSFFRGMYQAYADHRPFVLSPDMIWLLICQGFSLHVINNSEELRNYFVDFSGKISLIVRNDCIRLNNPDSPWESVFPEFTEQISKFTGRELINTLTCDFTTTTPVSKVASEITIMVAMKPYFEYIVMRFVCGIPEITLEGTPEDWQKVLDKAKYIRKFKLDWWIDEIEPILEEFVDASKGDISKRFWRKMFKEHSADKYGAPNIIDGWIVKFFPYDKWGKRNNLDELNGTGDLPSEIVNVDFEFVEVYPDKTVSTPLEFCAGFVGLQQDPVTFALKPEIGWKIQKKELDNISLKDELIQKEIEKNSFKEKQKQKNKFTETGFSFGNEVLGIRVRTVPQELLDLEFISSLEIIFVDGIKIPDEMAKIKIDNLELWGEISNAEITRICNLLPKTKLRINGKYCNE
ncbi:MAG: hypothetical protein HW421_2902 [Ignavibacteria bacterium]|nr:hypothetical protein [Ignavibacteria bacterium]